MSSLIRIGVLDEQEVVHFGLRACFSALPDMVVTGGYFRAESALHAIERGGIDLLLMDPVLRYQGSLDFIRNLHLHYSKLRILMFLTDPSATAASMLLDAGAHGVVSKRQSLADCIQAIRMLAAGQQYCSPDMEGGGASIPSPALTNAHEAEAMLLSLPGLSVREREVLRLCIDGLTVTCIAARFGRSSKTVSTQKQAAYRKLGLKSDMDLFRRLARYGG
ncbi:Capsular synthesis regulator component B [Pseudomonas synxantha]|uniref:Capsular synthesis regulator component B n=1 Tax=Pseudomonas synxantha TaxID=47883 RepID=A0A3G7UC35_9PSED|nr:response regulator transcription factor [Pseudomonas synxantha]AZE56833.1 Capsular synthesis regulator component B [Pseudomonas synxantha]